MTILYIFGHNRFVKECICEECPKIETNELFVTQKIKVDIKGYVKKPGVYEVEKDAIVNDLIKMAGGLKTNGTTDNINLSKKLYDEDMIVILSKSELKKQNTVNTNKTISNSNSDSIIKNATNNSISSIEQEQKKENNEKISLNNATKEELMTLTGIGEAKALLIIEYRAKTPFKEISEIKNISGIGDSIYEKIKDNITI